MNRLAQQYPATTAAGVRRSWRWTSGSSATCDHGRAARRRGVRAGDRVCEHRQPAARPRNGQTARSSRSAWRSARRAPVSCASCSPSRWCWLGECPQVGMVVAWWSLRWRGAPRVRACRGLDSDARRPRARVHRRTHRCDRPVMRMLPALHASAGSISAGLGETSRTSEGRRAGARDALVALGSPLPWCCSSAPDCCSSFNSLSHVDTGIRTENLLTFDVFLSGARARRSSSGAHSARVRQRITALPGLPAPALR